MDLHVSTHEVGGRPVVALEGIADLASVPLLQDQLRRAVLLTGPRTLVVELDGLAVIDDAALGVVLGAAAQARTAGGDLEIVCTEQRLRARLAVTRFDRAVTVRDTIT